jgi:membrane glycosyltransferase
MNDAPHASVRALPEEAPLEMPIQSLRAAPARGGRPVTAPRGIGLRRLAVIGGAAALTAAGGWQMYFVLNGAGASPLGLLLLALFLVLFAWIALALTSAVAGFGAVLAGGGLGLGIARSGPLPTLLCRTAVLMPTYNESPARVMAGLEAIMRSIDATGAGAAFDFFILSDTTNADIWIAEEAAFLALRARTGRDGLFYRRRPRNTGRKAGNLGDWVRRFGAAYAQMLTLDADSLMQGETIVRLAAAMEQNPGVGLIQTLPLILRGTTLFARTQQFAGRVYGPLIAQGIAWWHGAEGNYWGHNAIIRTRAFAEQAGLPELPGRRPFGGHILSHDFVEAALMRRGGWAIHMVPALGGSFEESPPSATDVAIRDRRWCQGNLQHAGVIGARGLHWVSRLHLLMGIGSYVTSPLWLLFLLLGVAISLQARFVRPAYFGAGKSLFPQWPHVDPVRAKYVFLGTMVVLLAPKLLAFLLLLLDTKLRRGCGGAVRAFVSVLLETLVGGLLAPVFMMVQSGAVADILLGRDSGWNAQRRDDGGIPFRQIWARYARIALFGVALAAAAYAVSVPLFLWMLPVLVGLALAPLLAAGTASRRAGLALRRLGLLRIPEEVAPPAVLVAAEAPPCHERVGEGVGRLLDDPALLAAHVAMLPPPPNRRAPVDAALVLGLAKVSRAERLGEALAALTAAEKAAVLGSAEGVAELVSLGGRE